MLTLDELNSDDRNAFDDSVAKTLEIVGGWLTDPRRAAEVDAVDDGIFVRNLDRVLVLFNATYSRMFLEGQGAPGRSSRIYLRPTLAKLSESSDDLLLAGAMHVELRHQGAACDGREYDLLVHKRLLHGAGHPPYIVGVVRPLAQVDVGDGKPANFDDLYRIVQGLDAADLTICRRVCTGATNQALSDELGVTTRAIEMRRQKILVQLGLANTVELIKLLVRLQDRGYIDLGI